MSYILCIGETEQEYRQLKSRHYFIIFYSRNPTSDEFVTTRVSSQAAHWAPSRRVASTSCLIVQASMLASADCDAAVWVVWEGVVRRMTRRTTVWTGPIVIC